MFTKEFQPFPGTPAVRVVIKDGRRIVRVKYFASYAMAGMWVRVMYPTAALEPRSPENIVT